MLNKSEKKDPESRSTSKDNGVCSGPRDFLHPSFMEVCFIVLFNPSDQPIHQQQTQMEGNVKTQDLVQFVKC